ncbi:sulfurtransferase [Microbacterium sp. SORGH_AS_0888]|uniref:sulfurtransferase n=1 Tax=Microbacterium sp. SORGH_AS_0888 TaxID=3041791 RepID=UPI002782A784|nr:sulfurtransferase [Microbacterium sp. SORGH_AS_0888]MDQ1130530.1 thiosulfate/3-mercaptopyruvate sulfurtransferase [Microbacterium sp. SORGH_AS_0888]
MAEILTTPEELRAALDTGAYPDGGPVRILDVRWRLDRPDGRPEYLAGHIPGAVYVDLDHELAEHGDDPGAGRHPLPPVAALQESARRWGIRTGDTVVVYDDLKNLSSARAWWLLRFAGVEDVRILDGSLRGWTGAGFELETGEAAAPETGDVVLAYGALPHLDLADVPAFAESHVLLDARAGDRYRGEVEPVDPRAGHVPGAVSAPTTENVDAAGRFLSPEALRERFTALGATADAPVGVYCGSGVTASHEAVALTLAGYEARVFPGSWSQWSNHPELPVAVGAEPR